MLVVSSVLIFVSESWVVTSRILQPLGSYHNRAAKRISVWMPQFRNFCWEYPLVGEALAEAGLEPIGDYIYRRHTSVAQCIAMRTIFNITDVKVRRPGSPAPCSGGNRRGYVKEYRIVYRTRVLYD